MSPGRAGLPDPTPVSDNVVVPTRLVKLTTPVSGEVSHAAPSAHVVVVMPLLRDTVSGDAVTVEGSHPPRSSTRPAATATEKSRLPTRTEGEAFQNLPAASRLLLSERLEAELLAANTRLEHEAPLTGGEDRHAVLIFGVRRRALGRGHRACLSRQR